VFAIFVCLLVKFFFSYLSDLTNKDEYKNPQFTGHYERLESNDMSHIVLGQ